MAGLSVLAKAALLVAASRLASGLQIVTDANSTGEELVEGRKSLCHHGHFVPRFFLLGTPKSGTTYFFENFARSKGIVHYKPFKHEETWHSKEPWVFSGGFDMDYMHEWLSHYPSCKEGRYVAVDCTPGYFGNAAAAAGIHKVYTHLNFAKSLVFMVFLRNPIYRTHSHYYQFEENGVKNDYFPGCSSKQFPESFKIAVKKRLHEGTVCNCDCDLIFDDSMYVRSFEHYFHHFNAKQFHVVPFEYAVEAEVASYAWRILGVARGKGEKSTLVGAKNEKNHHEYDSLRKDLDDPKTLKAYKRFFKKHASPWQVAKVLAHSGAHLYKLHGKKSVRAISHWLESNWGSS